MHWLLIVPYGIETNVDDPKLQYSFLLIVPYGIETSKKWSDKQNSAAFNRTLWN